MGLLLEEDGIKFPQMEGYESSKLANVLHAKELARQLDGNSFEALLIILNSVIDLRGLPLATKFFSMSCSCSFWEILMKSIPPPPEG